MMQASAKHIGLILGILTVLLSFLFFGRRQELYQLLLISGFLVSSVCFLWILFGSESIKSKLVWTGIVAVSIALNWGTEPFLVDASYSIYLKQHDEELAEVNEILKHKQGDIWILRDSIRAKNGQQISSIEKQRLRQEQEKLGAYMILKTDSTIYYGLWGFLDVRLGLTYSISGRQPNIEYRHLTDNWFH